MSDNAVKQKEIVLDATDPTEEIRNKDEAIRNMTIKALHGFQPLESALTPTSQRNQGHRQTSTTPVQIHVAPYVGTLLWALGCVALTLVGLMWISFIPRAIVDGEIVGTGIEISFDVTFTVRLIKGREIHWPRAENDTHIMTVGNARPLDQAVQHATTEMIRFLQVDYGLDTRAIHVLLGQTVEYDVGNIFDPAYTMVCKISKSILVDIGASRR